MAGLVVMHVSDAPGDVPRALSAAKVITDTEPMRVNIIVNGPAIAGVEGGEIDPAEGVSIDACARAMAGRGMTEADLATGVGTVRSAVVALATAQHEGAAYIRI